MRTRSVDSIVSRAELVCPAAALIEGGSEDPTLSPISKLTKSHL